MKTYRGGLSKRQKRAERIRTGHGRRYTLAARRRARRRPFLLLALARMCAAAVAGACRIGAIAASAGGAAPKGRALAGAAIDAAVAVSREAAERR